VTDNVALTAEGQYDSVRGRQGWLGVRFTVPFGGPKEKPTGLKRRMTADPVRDVDIVTAAVEEEVAPAYSAPVINTETETAQRVIHVDNSAGGGGDGTIENPFNTLAAAQALLQDFDVLYINRGTGTTAGMNAGLAVARNNVWVIGSGTDFIYDAGRFSAPVEDNLNGTVLAAAGLAPVITNVNVNGDGIYVTGADNYIGGVTVNAAARHGIYAFAGAGANLRDLTVSNVTSNGNTGSGLFINAQAGGDIGDVTAENVTFQNNLGATGWGIQFLATDAGSTVASGTFRDVTVTGNANRGIYALVNNGAVVDTLDFDDITAQTNNGTTAGGLVVSVTGAASRLETARISNSTISNNVTGGLIVQSANSATLNTTEISNVTANSNGGLGMYLNAELAGIMNFLDVSDITTNSNVGQGIQVRAASNADIGTVTLDDLTSHNNTTANGRGIEITTAGAGSTITDLTLSNSNFSGNAALGVYIPTTGAGAIASLSLSHITSSANVDRGVYVLAGTDGDIGTVTLNTITSENNTGGVGRGIQITATDAGSTITSAAVTNSTVSGNNNIGFYTAALTDGVISDLSVSDLVSTGSVGSNGISLDAQTRGQITSATFERITSTTNAGRGLYVIAQSDGDIGTVTVDGLTSQNNTGASGLGMEVTATGAGSTISIVNVMDATISGNAQQGAFLQASTNAIINTIDIDNMTSTGNLGATGRGLQLLTGTGSSITSTEITDSVFSSNAAVGLYITPTNGGLFDEITVSNITTNGNAAQGMHVLVQSGGDINTLLIDDLTSQNNTGASGRGLELGFTAVGSILGTATITDSIFSGNAQAGFYANGAVSGLLSNLEMENIQSGSNGAQGVLTQVASGSDIGTVTMDNITSNNNATAGGRGIEFIATGAGSTITSAAVTNSTVSGNGNSLAGTGLAVSAASSGVITSFVASNVAATANAGAGVAFDSRTAGSQLTATLDDITATGSTLYHGFSFVIRDTSTMIVRMQGNTSTGNASYGIIIDDDSTGTVNIDLGGGTLGSTGGNRIFGSTSGTDVRGDFDDGQLKAENNWWGNAAGLLNARTNLDGASSVDSTPFLVTDPGP
jgi:hypothetical protein